MRESLVTLLDSVFDYAGLFPPAQLSMEESVANYLRYASGPESPVLGRFVCAATSLAGLADQLLGVQPHPAISLSVIGRPSSDLNSWESAREADAASLNAFLTSAGNQAEIETFEVRIPSHSMLTDCCRDLRGFTDAEVFIELPWAAELPESLAALADMDWINPKVRLGGTTAAEYPSAEQVGDFLHGCVSLDLPFKLTAGLHHPFPVTDASTGGGMHGFLNVLAGSALAYEYDLSRRELRELLTDSSPDSFEFSDEGISWRGEEIGIETIAEVREIFVSIGTCSIEEPLSELRSLGLATA